MKTISYKNVEIFIYETEEEGVAVRTFAGQYRDDLVYQGNTKEHLQEVFSRHGLDDPGDDAVHGGICEGISASRAKALADARAARGRIGR